MGSLWFFSFAISPKEMTLSIMFFSELILVFILPLMGMLQPKIGVINSFPPIWVFKLCLSKILKRIAAYS